MEPRPDHQFNPFSPDARTYDDDDLDMNTVDFAKDPLAFLKAIGAGQPGGMPLPQLKSPTDVRKEALERSANIFASFDTLKLIIERHEALIQKRWKKKTQKARLAILLAAWKGPMSAHHRPDFEAFRKESEAQRDAGTKYRDAFMWPYVNQEDLLKPKNLLLLLNARGRHGPAVFAAADVEAAHLGLVTQAIVPIFLNEHVMLFRGRTSPKTYGQLIAWEDHPDAFDWMHTRKEQMPGEGLLILEIQERLMSFLLDCAQQILLDIDEKDLLHGPIQAPPPSVSESQAKISSLATMTAEEPYKIPSQLDLDNIETLLAAKRDEAADHLWALREDPGYFNHYMQDASEHRQERIKDFNGQLHPLFQKHKESILWGRVLGHEITAAYVQYEMWSELHKLAVALRSMQSKYDAKIQTDDDLPADYMYALLEFRHWLNQTAKGPIGILKVATFASPPWRPYVERRPVFDEVDTKIAVRTKDGVKFDKDQTQLLWLLQTLWEDGKPLFFVGITILTDELQRLLDMSTKASSMVTAYEASSIADLSVVAQCLRQLGRYQPWANTFENAMVDHKDTLIADFAKRTQVLGRLLEALKGGSEKVLAHKGAPDEIDFCYPVNRRRTKENIETMRTAENNLDQFWAQVDRLMQSKAGSLTGTAIRTLLSDRTLRRTSEWVEPSKKETNKSSLQVEELQKPLSEIYFDLEQRTERTIASQPQPVPTKIKEKSRGQPDAKPSQLSPTQPDAEIEAATNSATTPKPKIFEVDARALKVFKTLFFTQSITATPGEIPWTDFLHAMASTGFNISKLGGSMWLFEPTDSTTDSAEDVRAKRKIILHEPHPVSKIPYMIARRHGRRLHRVYGWTGEMFRLAANTTEESKG